MNEARKFPDHEPAASGAVNIGPVVSGPEVFTVEAQAVDPAAATVLVHDESPAQTAQNATLLVTPLRAKIAPNSGSFGRRLATHMLIFTLLGLATFGLGAAAAWGLVTGALDGHTSQLKDLMHQAKDLLHQWTGR